MNIEMSRIEETQGSQPWQMGTPVETQSATREQGTVARAEVPCSCPECFQFDF